MAIIERHPALDDYFVELTLAQISSQNGIADIFETGRLILLKDYRLDFDFSALTRLNKSTELIDDRELRRKLKKLTALHFFEGEKPVARRGRLLFADPVRQAVFDVLCRGNRDVFERAAGALKSAHDELHRIFKICFPNYETFRSVPSVRLTQTLFENLHWDNHSINDDFHQARIFANLDIRPRLWSVGRGFTDWVRKFYIEHDLGRFAGKDPNLMIAYITGEVLGGTRNSWMDREPRHRIAFEPGEVWLAESRLISHQIYYGEAAMVYMWFVDPASMSAPSNRFNEQVEQVHREMREKEAKAI
ncbi:MAG TPA: hypothetical protein VFH89_05600 [Sphingomicrobium sp.]|nr:hypothetical protein [Sphingomicrobium sp.]